MHFFLLRGNDLFIRAITGGNDGHRIHEDGGFYLKCTAFSSIGVRNGRRSDGPCYGAGQLVI
jgi:hypothetical protein